MTQAAENATAPQDSSIEQKLGMMGLGLPPVAAPAGVYVPAMTVGDTVYTSGQLPFVEGALPQTGKVGAEISAEDAANLASIAALNALAAIKQQIGDLERVTQIVKLTVFVASDAAFTAQPKVANGASELIGELFGERGVHVRSAVGVAVLPMDSPVELEVTATFA